MTHACAHRPYGSAPAFIAACRQRIVTALCIPNDGDRFTVNVASSFRRWEEHDQFHAAMYRQIVDLRRPQGSRWIVAPGQGGNPDALHYDDLLERWRQLSYLPMPVTPPAR